MEEKNPWKKVHPEENPWDFNHIVFYLVYGALVVAGLASLLQF